VGGRRAGLTPSSSAIAAAAGAITLQIVSGTSAELTTRPCGSCDDLGTTSVVTTDRARRRTSAARRVSA